MNWPVPTPEERQILERNSINPDHVVVKGHSKDGLHLFNLNTRHEIFIYF